MNRSPLGLQLNSQPRNDNKTKVGGCWSSNIHQSTSSSEHTSGCVYYLYSLFLIYFTQKTFSGNIFTYMIKKKKWQGLPALRCGGTVTHLGGHGPQMTPHDADPGITLS